MRSTSRRQNIQAVGLQCAYTSDERINRVCRQTMALPFLPADVIADEFQTLHTASDDPRLAQHLQYMERLLSGQSSVSRCGPTTTWRAATSTYTSCFSCCTQKLHLYSLTCACCLKATQCGCSASPSWHCTVVSANTGTSTWPALAPLIVCCVRVRTFARTCRLGISILLCTVVTISYVFNF